MHLNEWIEKWWQHLPPGAQADFMQMIWPHNFVEPDPSGKSENAVMADGRIIASKEFGAPLWRNNSGAAMMINPKRPDDPPRHVRFGLGNDSKRVNDAWKSSDLIGIKPVTIRPEHIGAVFGLFTAIETKKPGWTLQPSDSRAQGQQTFMQAVTIFGGLAGFAQSADDVRRILNSKG